MAYDIKTAEDKILKACKLLVEKGLIARTWGNISARLSTDEFLVTPSGRSYDTLKAEELVRVRIKDHSYDGDIKPSSEKGMHAELYKLRKDCNFIIHTHQSNASALSVYGEDFNLDEYSEEIVSPEDKLVLGQVIPCAKYGLSSTKRLTNNIARSAKENPESCTVLMKHHGAVIMGKDDEEAFKACDVLEEVCGRIYEKKCGEKIHEYVVDWQGKEIEKGYELVAKAPYIMEMCRRGKRVYAYLDDMAMISGYTTECIKDRSDEKELQKAIEGRNAVLVKDVGAICFAPDKEEAEAVAIILEKNCRAANLALKKALSPVNKISAAVERKIYVEKYSKLKNAGGQEDA